MEIGTVGVVGLGTMGAGIAEVFARAGLSVFAVEIDDAALAAGRGRFETSTQRAVDRGRLDLADRDAMLGRTRFSTDRADLAAADLVIEAVPERLDIKASLFDELDRICPPHTVLATNTSSLPVTRIAAATGRPGRVIGMHFFNPAPVMKLVEVVHTVRTDVDAVDAVRGLAERCGKTPVVVGDRAGFVANALLFGYLNQAARMAETGHAPVVDIDAAMTAGCGLPMGPLTLMDLIGLDVCVEVLEVMYDETRDQRYAPAPLLRRLVMAGQLGRKTGRGYYVYEGRDARPAVAVPAPEPVADARGAVCRVHVTGAGAAAELAHVLDAAAASVDEADLVVHLPHAPRRDRVAEVAPVTKAGLRSADDVAKRLEAAGRTAVRTRHRPGLLVEALLFRHLDDAVRMADDGYASPDDIDTAMRLGCGYPDGPFAMLSAVGPRVVADGLRAMGVAPSALLRELAQS